MNPVQIFKDVVSSFLLIIATYYAISFYQPLHSLILSISSLAQAKEKHLTVQTYICPQIPKKTTPKTTHPTP